MTQDAIKARHRRRVSTFTEGGHPKLAIKFTAEQMDFLNRQAMAGKTSLAEIVRRCVQAKLKRSAP